MSNWTHVAGIVRIDMFRSGYIPVEKFVDFAVETFGKEIRYGSPDELWDEAYKHPERFLPLGSEGSLSLSVWVNPNVNSVAALTVSVFGDLRDHDDPDEIIEWFKNKCNDEDLIIRNAVITVHNEYNGDRTWTYGED